MNILLCRLSLSITTHKATFFNQFRSFFIFRSDTASTPLRGVRRRAFHQTSKDKWLGNWTMGAGPCLSLTTARDSFPVSSHPSLPPLASISSSSFALGTIEHKTDRMANDTTTPTPPSASNIQSHTAVPPPSPRVTPRRWIMPITEESQEKHKEPRGVALQRNHRRNSSLMGGPSTDFACRVFPLILLACERTVGCTDALPV